MLSDKRVVRICFDTDHPPGLTHSMSELQTYHGLMRPEVEDKGTSAKSICQ